MTNDELSASRLLSTDVLTEAVEPDGSSMALSTAVATLLPGDVEVGLWEAGPGHDADTEVDEVFLVLSGTGTALRRLTSPWTASLTSCRTVPAETVARGGR